MFRCQPPSSGCVADTVSQRPSGWRTLAAKAVIGTPISAARIAPPAASGLTMSNRVPPRRSRTMDGGIVVAPGGGTWVTVVRWTMMFDRRVPSGQVTRMSPGDRPSAPAISPSSIGTRVPDGGSARQRRSKPGIGRRNAATASAALNRGAGGCGARMTIAAVVATLSVATATPNPPIATSALSGRLMPAARRAESGSRRRVPFRSGVRDRRPPACGASG